MPKKTPDTHNCLLIFSVRTASSHTCQSRGRDHREYSCTRLSAFPMAYYRVMKGGEGGVHPRCLSSVCLFIRKSVPIPSASSTGGDAGINMGHPSPGLGLRSEGRRHRRPDPNRCPSHLRGRGRQIPSTPSPPTPTHLRRPRPRGCCRASTRPGPRHAALRRPGAAGLPSAGPPAKSPLQRAPPEPGSGNAGPTRGRRSVSAGPPLPPPGAGAFRPPVPRAGRASRHGGAPRAALPATAGRPAASSSASSSSKATGTLGPRPPTMPEPWPDRAPPAAAGPGRGATLGSGGSVSPPRPRGGSGTAVPARRRRTASSFPPQSAAAPASRPPLQKHRPGTGAGPSASPQPPPRERQASGTGVASGVSHAVRPGRAARDFVLKCVKEHT